MTEDDFVDLKARFDGLPLDSKLRLIARLIHRVRLGSP
jgi:hypothetical protein